MAIQIYKITRRGGDALRFEGKDGTDFTDPNGMANPQLSTIVGKHLMKYVRCEVSAGTAEVLGEASAEEIAEYEGPTKEEKGEEQERDPGNPYRLFPGR